MSSTKPLKQSVKVVIRTRPTNNFCSKNLNIDPVHSVSTSSQQNSFDHALLIYFLADSTSPLPAMSTLMVCREGSKWLMSE